MEKSITKKICKLFINNPSINPITGKRIRKDGATYKKLQKACNHFKLKMTGGSVQPLDPQQEFLSKVIFSSGTQDSLNKARDTYVTFADIMTLKPENWVNDAVIDFCMAMFQITDDIRGGSSIFLPCRAWNQRSISDLNSIIRNRMQYKYTREKAFIPIDRYMFPVNMNKNHWILVQVTCSDNKILLYDSLLQDPLKENPDLNAKYKTIIDKIKKRIKIFNNFMTSNSIANLCNDNWTITYSNKPEQKNGYDCGVFVILSADCLSRNSSCTPFFQQEDIDIWRKKILLDILYFDLNLDLKFANKKPWNFNPKEVLKVFKGQQNIEEVVDLSQDDDEMEIDDS